MDINEKVKAALTTLGQATADEVARELERQTPDAFEKQLIAGTHAALTELYNAGELSGDEQNGDLVYRIKN